MCTYLNILKCVIHVYTYIYIYIYTCTYIYIYMYMYRLSRPPQATKHTHTGMKTVSHTGHCLINQVNEI